VGIVVVASVALAIQAGPQPTPPQREAVTAELLHTAYRDAESRQLVARARRERLEQDSSLTSYEAIGRQRLTVSAGIGAGIQRTAYRVETVFRINWHDKVGAEVQLTGARAGTPILPEVEESVLKDAASNPDMSPIPYTPGQEPLWPVGGATGTQVDDQLIHPLAVGAEAYYIYESGPTTRVSVPNWRPLVLREVKVRPRVPRATLVVGSLWFDEETGQLVRAAYRLAAPVMLKFEPTKPAPGVKQPGPIERMIVRGITSPIRVEISGVAVEYGLYQGRYWLPKSRSLEASGQVSFAKGRVEIEQTFTYPSVNGPGAPTRIALNEPVVGRIVVPDSLRGDRARRWRDSVWVARSIGLVDSINRAPCDSTGYRLVARRRGKLPVALSYPCDIPMLARSADFTGPLYAPNEDVFGTDTRDDMLARALPFGAQAAVRLDALPPADVLYGLSMTRYNRIEGLSSGVHVEQQLGGGYFVGATGRIGTADREPNGDLSFARTNLNTTVALTGYRRLVAANDWGQPLSFGSSVSAFLFGRDEGFYYRATGAELTWSTARGAHLDWRLFGEQDRTATQRTDYSWGATFVPNIKAANGGFTGAGARWSHTTGVDPRGWRTMTDLRLEGATGDSTYGRGAIDETFVHPLVGSLSGALTLSGGSSLGELPSQRRWFLGGTQTIRGQSADTAQSGNAFGMTRAELESAQTGYCVVLFSDLGWVGDRSAISNVGRPLSGAGVGLSAFDGLLRFDVARGFYPRRQTRIAFYLGGAF
jgi:hypothetical protein